MVSLRDGLAGSLDRKTNMGWDIFSSLLSHPKHPRTLGLTASMRHGRECIAHRKKKLTFLRNLVQTRSDGQKKSLELCKKLSLDVPLRGSDQKLLTFREFDENQSTKRPSNSSQRSSRAGNDPTNELTVFTGIASHDFLTASFKPR